MTPSIPIPVAPAAPASTGVGNGQYTDDELKYAYDWAAKDKRGGASSPVSPLAAVPAVAQRQALDMFRKTAAPGIIQKALQDKKSSETKSTGTVGTVTQGTKPPEGSSVAKEGTVAPPPGPVAQDPNPELLDNWLAKDQTKRGEDQASAMGPGEDPAQGKAQDPETTADVTKPTTEVAAPEKPQASLAAPGDTVTPADAPAVKAIKTETALPVPPSTYAPIKKEPDFWAQVMDVAAKTGKSMLSILADFTAGYAGKETPSAIRARMEQEKAMQGQRHAGDLELSKVQNESARTMAEAAYQHSKELQTIQAGFDAKQQAAQLAMNEKLANTQDATARARIQSDYNLTVAQLNSQREIAQMNYLLTYNTQSLQGGSVQGRHPDVKAE